MLIPLVVLLLWAPAGCLVLRGIKRLDHTVDLADKFLIVMAWPIAIVLVVSWACIAGYCLMCRNLGGE